MLRASYANPRAAAAPLETAAQRLERMQRNLDAFRARVLAERDPLERKRMARALAEREAGLEYMHRTSKQQ